MSDIFNFVLRVLKLLISVGFLSHWMACIFYLVSRECSQYTQQAWIIQEGLIDMSVYDQYINSLYWAVTTMLTVPFLATFSRLDTAISPPPAATKGSAACSA